MPILSIGGLLLHAGSHQDMGIAVLPWTTEHNHNFFHIHPPGFIIVQRALACLQTELC